MEKSSEASKYTAARTRAVFVTVPQPGYLLLSGPDSVPFLQRQTTNDLRNLKEGLAITTVLTSPTARILDVFTVFNEADLPPERSLGVLTLPGRGVTTGRYLQSHIFFMDKVQVRDVSQEYAQFDIDGPLASSILRESGVASLPDINQILPSYTGGAASRIIGRQGSAGIGFRLIAPAPEAQLVQEWLASVGIEELTQDEFTLLRIEAGLPGEKGELIEDYTPLETNLDQFISNTKGCYTGQEILARQITYDKVTRKMAGLKMSAAVQTGNPVIADGKPAGKVTSAAISPRFGPIALAVLKRPYFESGTPISVETLHGEKAGTVTGLPFN